MEGKITKVVTVDRTAFDRLLQLFIAGFVGWIAISVNQLQQGQSASNEIHRSLLEKVSHNETEISELWRYHRRPSREPEDRFLYPKEAIHPESQRLIPRKKHD